MLLYALNRSRPQKGKILSDGIQSVNREENVQSKDGSSSSRSTREIRRNHS